MFAVAVHDAQGREVPIADNEVRFQISGPGKLIGTGNGDPTDHASDKGASRKAFSGLCMAVVQSTKQPGSITVQAASPGLVPATVTISTREGLAPPPARRLAPRSPRRVRVSPASGVPFPKPPPPTK